MKQLPIFSKGWVVTIAVAIALMELGNQPTVGAAPSDKAGNAPTSASVAPASIAKAPFLSEIEAFEKSDKIAAPPRGAVLFLGSSSIRLWTSVAQDFPEIPVVNRGFGGSLIEDSLRYADRIVMPYQPKLIVFYAGTNDINADKTPKQVLQDFQNFVAKVQEAMPTSTIAYISINPSWARWTQETKILRANSLIEKFIHATNSTSRKLAFIDSHSRLLGADGQPQASLLRDDKLHLNAEGYKAWTAIVRPQILALAADAGVKRLAIPTPK